ncbi:MAG: TetR/AcrR family transcriptional regulator [Actinomycetia bacterium]|nr:TetR/AcrR family transcriptional regulator [Actinomycetes bacterium]MCP4961908.1 TetR/AcrR family transcriptional regulator [Actinomycetes bacterium]
MPTAVECETRDVLLDAAESLFAAEGLADVSLAAITRLAGQRNGGAIHYHFGGRDGLLNAIFERHQTALDAARMEALIALRRRGQPAVSDLVRVVVESIAGRLDSTSGRCFLEIQRHRLVELAGAADHRTATVRMIAAELEALVGDRFDREELDERNRLITQMIVNRLADRSREEALGTARLSRERMLETLVASATAIVGGEV